MDEIKSFPFAFNFKGEHYKGTITPSEDTGKDGRPVYFRVMMGDKLFAYLCCGDKGWRVHLEDNHNELINAVGTYIDNHYSQELA